MNPVSHTRQWMTRNRGDVLRVMAAAIAVGAVLLLTHGWWDEIKAALMNTHAFVFLMLLCVLPAGGVSVALLYVVVGARFGASWGLLIVAVATAVHLGGMHVIARHVLRGPVEGLMRRRNYRLPDFGRKEPVSLALLGALMPGIPYFARNYLLALSGVPFPIYASICWPVYVIRSAVSLFLGDWATELTVGRVLFLIGFYAVKIGICAAVVWHLRRKRDTAHVSTEASHTPKAA